MGNHSNSRFHNISLPIELRQLVERADGSFVVVVRAAPPGQNGHDGPLHGLQGRAQREEGAGAVRSLLNGTDSI